MSTGEIDTYLSSMSTYNKASITFDKKIILKNSNNYEMASTTDSCSVFDSADTSVDIFDKAMIHSTESSTHTDNFISRCNNNNCAIVKKDYDSYSELDSNLSSSSSLTCDLSSQSIILAGSHKQNLCSLFSTERKEPVSPLRTTKNTPNKVENKAIPKIIVTQATPRKSPSSKFQIANKRDIVSPVAQYVRGNGVVKGGKILYKNT